MPAMLMKHDINPRDKLWADLGDISKVEVFNNQVLIALYIRPKITASGILLPDMTVDEDIYQSKMGIIVKKGPNAFIDPNGTWFKDTTFEIGDWVISRPSDGWSITVNKVPCRILDDVNIRGRIDDPDKIW